MSDIMIKTEQLTCKSGTRFLLNQIDWTVKKGEQWVVFGMNGSGKTTLLSTVAGYRSATRGKVRLFGEVVGADNILEMRRRVGWVSSSFFDNYYKNESSLEIILAGKTGTLGLEFSIDERDVRRAKALLRQVGLLDKCDMPFCTLSKGERQNILLARALFTDPEILILDEPCSGLDIAAREQVLQMISQMIEAQDRTIIYVTHYAEELLDGFTHALLLKKGRSFMQGRTEDCFSAQAMSDFLARPVTVTRDQDARLQIHFCNSDGCAAGKEE